MKTYKIFSIRFVHGIGLAYWLDDYKDSLGEGNFTQNLLLPFCKISWGQLYGKIKELSDEEARKVIKDNNL